MFERYTERARRSIFFGRFEASQLGSPSIETEHLLLGLFREDKAMAYRFLGSKGVVESIRRKVEDYASADRKERISTSVDLPLSNECRRALSHAAEEAERLSHKHIGCEHLLLGLLREDKSFAASLLHERGVRLSAVREILSSQPAGTTASESYGPSVEGSSQLKELGIDLVRQAMDNRLAPIVGREKELNQVIRILGRFKKNSPMLLGEPGVGKQALVDGLAGRIANGELPLNLRYESIVALDFSTVLFSIHDRATYDQLMRELLHKNSQILFLINGVDRLERSGRLGLFFEIGHILKPALLRGTIQCIGVASPRQYQKLLEAESWVEKCFEPVEVRELSEPETLQVLEAARTRYERFHRVTYTDEALQSAVLLSKCYILNRFLPDKALDLIDEAGTYVNLNQAPPPQEIRDCRSRLRVATSRMENAITDHELEKARFYSDEVRKEQENLKSLGEKYKTDDMPVVTREIIENVVSDWTGISVNDIRKARSREGGSPDTVVGTS